MTREEIMNMPAGREMDALIALIDGWKIDDMTATSPGGSRWSRNRHGDDNWLEYYSSDMAAVWSVAEKLGFSVIKVKDGWMAGDLSGAYIDENGCVDGYFIDQCTAETAPLAICREALISKLVDSGSHHG